MEYAHCQTKTTSHFVQGCSKQIRNNPKDALLVVQEYKLINVVMLLEKEEGVCRKVYRREWLHGEIFIYITQFDANSFHLQQ